MDLKCELEEQLEQLDIQLDGETLDSEIAFLNELLRWNKTHNLTAIDDPVEAVEKHLVDSLSVLPYLGQPDSVLDIGSGGGFPGLPLQIARPGLKIVSVDAVAKKIAFQRHAARMFKLKDFTPWHGRIEMVAHQPFAENGFDLIIARAFAPLKTLLELALPCLSSGGQIVAMKGADAENELVEAGDWLAVNGLSCYKQVSLELPRSKAQRFLLFFRHKTQDME
jgi:16S rRNA (guanine527-N7)-methyltransferase